MDNKQRKHLANMTGPWKMEDPSIHVILVSDPQFENLANHPDEAVEKIFPQDKEPISLREHCRKGAELGASKMAIAYDYFFGGSSRSLYPDTDKFQSTLKKVHDVAAEYGIGLEPSIISPLELGIGYKAQTGESGRWMHYREGLRDPETGAYSVMMWQHTRWTNNKGPSSVKLIGIRAFAFKEKHIPNTTFYAVPPESLVELPTPEVESMPGTRVDVGELVGGVANLDAMFQATRIRVHGSGGPTGNELDRVLVVLQYESVEMDYFSPTATQFMDQLVDQYHQKGISLVGVYSDEMHIQQDWSYHTHFDNGQFNMRYASPGLEKAFAVKYGDEYKDFARYMLYFTAHQHDFLPTHEPKLPCQHVFGESTEDIARTLAFRKDYFYFLESTVVNLANRARKGLEKNNGRDMDTYYHATWAESPTCDAIAVGGVHDSWSPEEHQRRYDYTPDFIWSNTIHQASAACANYFLWNEFLCGGNNDIPEGGYADRNYYARAIACSLAALNRKPLASAGMWGMPPEVSERMLAVSEVYGALGYPTFRSIQDYSIRQTEVLFLYPQDLVAVDERFGSWMTQYGYANYITADKLTEYGTINSDGTLQVKNTTYNTLCVLYEPFPTQDLLTLISKFVNSGGKVVWSSIPPFSTKTPNANEWMKEAFGVTTSSTPDPLGLPLPGRTVDFTGKFSHMASQIILTDFPVDRVFPVQPVESTEILATLNTGGPQRKVVVGTRKQYAGGGQAIFLGFRPRDDQAASTGTEIRTWFDLLNSIGSYPSDKKGVIDNPTIVSRTTEYLATSFSNGAIAICPHYATHPENFKGGFYRDEAKDKLAMEQNPLPSDAISIKNFKVKNQTVTFNGKHAATWRLDPSKGLVGFSGKACTDITINSTKYQWTASPADIAWHPLDPSMQTEGYIPLYRVWCGEQAKVTLPLAIDQENIEIWAGAYVSGYRKQRKAMFGKAGYGDTPVNFTRNGKSIEIDIDENLAGRWLYIVQPKA